MISPVRADVKKRCESDCTWLCTMPRSAKIRSCPIVELTSVTKTLISAEPVYIAAVARPRSSTLSESN